LTPSVIVSLLSPQDFIPGKYHGRTATNHEDCNEVFCLAPAKHGDRRVIRWTFGPTEVVIGAIAVLFTVDLVICLAGSGYVRQAAIVLAYMYRFFSTAMRRAHSVYLAFFER
jgi:hypothetical protein